MTFTYIGDLSTDLDNIRFNIQDTTSGLGIKPQGLNFTDEEINGILSKEGSVGRATAALFETLSVTWSTYVDTSVEERSEAMSQTAKNYMTLAKRWRDTYGYGEAQTTIVTGFVTRVDGYSDDIDAGES
jgi:hypothetical protein